MNARNLSHRVTLQGLNGETRTLLWDGHSPLALDWPIQHVLRPSGHLFRLPAPGQGAQAMEMHSLREGPVRLASGLLVRLSQAKTLPESSRLQEKGSAQWKEATQNAALWVPRSETQADSEVRVLKKALLTSSLTLALAVTLGGLFQSPSTEVSEVVPPQFAKLVMEAGSSAPATGSSAADAGSVIAQSQVLQQKTQALVSGGLAGALRKSPQLGKMSALQASQSLLKQLNQSSNLGSNLSLSSNSGLGGTPGGVKVASLGNGLGGYGSSSGTLISGQGRTPVQLTLPDPVVQEGLTKEEVGEVIHSHLSEIRYCYEAAMLRTSAIEGKLQVAFVIGASGRVNRAEPKSSTLSDIRLGECVISKLRTWQFPRTKGGVDVAVNYPFLFKTLGK